MRKALIAVVLMTATAYAEELVLHPQDSITIDGTRYTCADSSRRGVQMAPGDRLSAGKWRLRCTGDDSGGGDPGEPEQTPVVSTVDPACIGSLYDTVSGHPTAADAIQWASACRTIELHGCRITTEQPDQACYSKLDSVISGSFSGTDAAAAERACHRIEASCPTHRNPATVRIDLGCLDQLYSRTSGKPTPSTVVSWLSSCRTRTSGRCTPIAGSFDAQCVSKAYQMISGKFSGADAAAVARSCRAVELRCD